MPICSSSGIWPRRSGRRGLSPSRPGVNSTARMSDVAVSMARCILRHWRRPCTPCLRACHLLPGNGLPANHERAPSPSNVIPVLSTARQGIAQQCPERDQQVQRAIHTAKGDLHGQDLLLAPQRREVRHGPVQPRQLQQARQHPGSLAQWQLEKDLDRQAELDGRIAKTPQAVRVDRHAARARSYLC
jgi:hypothetical protein